METGKRLADAIARVKTAADTHSAHIVHTSDISRADRELLTLTNWLQEVIKGWYMLVRPDMLPGDSTAWYANFWDFLRIYLEERYGKEYCLSAESSLELQIGKTVMPQQVIVITSQGGTMQQLPFDTSILTYADPKNLPDERIEMQGLQMMPLELALCRVTPSYFHKCPGDAEIALRLVKDPGELNRVITKYDFVQAANRLVGAYQFIGMKKFANQMASSLSLVGMKIQLKNPFVSDVPLLAVTRLRSPHAARVEALWMQYRQSVISIFPDAPGLPKNPETYLKHVDKIYQYDAYNSLSIEGYHVSEQLIEKVRNHQWDPQTNPEDKQQRDALAARGYYEAFNAVISTLKCILTGENPGQCVKDDLANWFQNLFAPSVRANIIPASDLFGYRRERVFIRNSRHIPPPKEAVTDSMEAFFHCLEHEENAAVRAVLGHYIFVYIHPYMDGNGRIARFLMNTMFASGGYPWTVVEVARRDEYINALESTHTQDQFDKFAEFILSEIAGTNE